MEDADSREWDRLIEESKKRCSICGKGQEPQDPLHIGKYVHSVNGEWVHCGASSIHVEIFKVLDTAGIL